MRAVNFIMALMALSSGSAAFAEKDWTFILKDDAGIYLFADKSSVKFRNEDGKDIIEIGVKITSTNPALESVYNRKLIKYTLATYEIACRQRESREQAEIAYFTDGTVGDVVYGGSSEPWLRVGEAKSPGGRWSPVNSSEFVHEILVNWVCN